VTDIHITHFGNADRSEQFEQFCNEIIKSLIKPQVTVVSGDLTHNRDRTFASEQYIQEWDIYKNILNRTNITKYTEWLDMRGNHGENYLFFFFEYLKINLYNK
jgi:Icc-related predicted phosphoesterase